MTASQNEAESLEPFARQRIRDMKKTVTLAVAAVRKDRFGFRVGGSHRRRGYIGR